MFVIMEDNKDQMLGKIEDELSAYEICEWLNKKYNQRLKRYCKKLDMEYERLDRYSVKKINEPEGNICKLRQNLGTN